jgi:Ankyrin repeats (3 copies)
MDINPEKPRFIIEEQKSLIWLMKKLGYKNIDPDSVCFGVSAMAMQAVLCGELEQFDKRRLRIKELFDKPPADEGGNDTLDHYDLDPSTKKEALEFKAFFDGVYLYQYPEQVAELYGHKKMRRQDVENTLPFTLPTSLKEKGITKVASCSGSYTINELANYFKNLHLALKKDNDRLLSLILHSAYHVINVSFDSEKKKWILIDPNVLPSRKREAKSYQGIATLVGEAFTAPVDWRSNNNAVFFHTEIFCKAPSTTIAAITSLKEDEEWKNLHTITPERIERKDAQGVNLLYLATYNGELDLVKEIITQNKKCISPDKECINPDNDKYIPLCVAAQEDHFEIVKFLVEQGADINQANTDGNTALDFAAENSREIYDYLLEKGGKIGIKNTDKLTTAKITNLPLDRKSEAVLPAHNGEVDLEKEITTQNKGCTKPDDPQYTPAAQEVYSKNVKFLVDQGANTNQTTKAENTASHFPAEITNLPLNRESKAVLPAHNEVFDLEKEITTQNKGYTKPGDPQHIPAAQEVYPENAENLFKIQNYLLEKGGNLKIKKIDTSTTTNNLKLGFFKKNLDGILAATTSSAIMGLTGGAILGGLSSTWAAIPTFGLSLLAIPVFMGIGFLGGALIGFTTGVLSSFIAEHTDNKKELTNNTAAKIQNINGRSSGLPNRIEPRKKSSNSTEWLTSEGSSKDLLSKSRFRLFPSSTPSSENNKKSNETTKKNNAPGQP